MSSWKSVGDSIKRGVDGISDDLHLEGAECSLALTRLCQSSGLEVVGSARRLTSAALETLRRWLSPRGL